MSRLLTLGLLVLLAPSAFAGANPDVRIYIDFDPPNYVHEFTPELYTQFRAYVCLDSAPGGVTSVSFGVNDLLEEYPGVVGSGAWVNLFPGWPLPPPTMPGGTTIHASECVTEGQGPILVGYMEYFCIGTGSACLEVLDHWDFQRWVVDCSDPGEVDYYCVLSHGSINGGTCPDGDCEPVPVRDQSWGAVKSLYR
ncbi:hypothetical protein KAW64_15440 [bacterium]|nr:hypothetical protein [bacterium]